MKGFVKSPKVLLILVSIFVVGGLSSCSSSSNKVDSGIQFDITEVNYHAVSIDEGELEVGARLLAAQCAQCHGTYGVAIADWPSLWGSGRGISKNMEEYQDTKKVNNVMHLHALTYTNEEIQLIKSYYEKITYSVAEGG